MPFDYFQKPVNVGAVRFDGWAEISHINQWLADLQPLFVPTGYEHSLRLQHEKDRSRGEALDSSPAFLVLTIDGKPLRVDVRHWIVRFPDGRVEIHDQKSFNEIFDKSEDTLKKK